MLNTQLYMKISDIRTWTKEGCKNNVGNSELKFNIM